MQKADWCMIRSLAGHLRLALAVTGLALLVVGGQACSDDDEGKRLEPVCGNGRLEQLEDHMENCDDGNQDNTDECPDDPGHGGTCQPAFCGDGFVWAGHEECDDGNTVSGDGCSDQCKIEVCGDGIVDPPTENCDDGNTNPGDGCSAQCRIELDWGCGGEPSTCTRSELDWVSIDAGTFEMGEDRSDARPIHTVTVPTFLMTRTEVTFKQYKVCVDAGSCTAPEMWAGEVDWDDPSIREWPATTLNWTQARAYCRWAGGDLPSEAQWEYAARSEGQAVSFPWGNAEANCDHVVAQGCSTTGATMPVCSKPDGNTQQGLCDMAGNAREWIADLYWTDYAGAPTDGSARMEVPRMSAQDRVVRGGSYLTNLNQALYELSATARDSESPNTGASDLGFRCVRHE